MDFYYLRCARSERKVGPPLGPSLTQPPPPPPTPSFLFSPAVLTIVLTSLLIAMLSNAFTEQQNRKSDFLIERLRACMLLESTMTGIERYFAAPERDRYYLLTRRAIPSTHRDWLSRETGARDLALRPHFMCLQPSQQQGGGGGGGGGGGSGGPPGTTHADGKGISFHLKPPQLRSPAGKQAFASLRGGSGEGGSVDGSGIGARLFGGAPPPNAGHM